MLAAATNDDFRISISKANGFGFHYEGMAAALDLTVDEAARADFHNCYYFWLHWGQFASTKDKKDLEELNNVLASYLLPSFKYSWDHSPYAKPTLDPAFVAFVEARLAAIKDIDIDAFIQGKEQPPVTRQ